MNPGNVAAASLSLCCHASWACSQPGLTCSPITTVAGAVPVVPSVVFVLTSNSRVPCFRSVRVLVGLVRPRFVRGRTQVGAQLLDLDPPLGVGPGEVFVLESVVEADLARRVEIVGEMHRLDARPVD